MLPRSRRAAEPLLIELVGSHPSREVARPPMCTFAEYVGGLSVESVPVERPLRFSGELLVVVAWRFDVEDKPLAEGVYQIESPSSVTPLSFTRSTHETPSIDEYRE